ILIGARLEVWIIGASKGAGIKDDGRPYLNEGTNAEAVMVATAVGKGKAREVIVSGNDVGIQIAVAIAALERGAGVRGAFEAIVNHATDGAGVPRGIESEVAGRCRPVIDAAVGDVDDEARGGELRLTETFAGQPGQVTSARGHVAGQV